MSVFPALGPALSPQNRILPRGWDRCVLADQVLPAFVTVNLSTRIKVDPKSKAGADGENPTLHGMDPQEGSLELETFSDADREELAAILTPLLPRPGRTPKPVSIDAASLRMLGISSVLVTGATALTATSPGRARMTVYIRHWLPTKKKSATTSPKGAPVRKIENVGPAGSDNPAPSAQPGFGDPPASIALPSGVGL